MKSLNQLMAEQRDVTCEAVRVLHESYERERSKLNERERSKLKGHSREQEEVIQASGSRRSGGHGVSNMGVSPEPNPYADLCLREELACRSRCRVVK